MRRKNYFFILLQYLRTINYIVFIIESKNSVLCI